MAPADDTRIICGSTQDPCGCADDTVRLTETWEELAAPEAAWTIPMIRDYLAGRGDTHTFRGMQSCVEALLAMIDRPLARPVLLPDEPAMEPTGPTTREAILAAAQLCVSADRNRTYGEPEDSFGPLGCIWDELDRARGDRPRSGVDVALALAALKLVRASTNPAHADNFVDLAGYAACAGELAGRMTGPGE